MSMLKSRSLTLSISHSLTLDMLNKFCFHLYPQKETCKEVKEMSQGVKDICLEAHEGVNRYRKVVQHVKSE